MTTQFTCMTVRSLLAAMIVGIAVVVAGACGGGGSDGGSTAATPTAEGQTFAEVLVATTLPVFADFVREAGGDRVDAFAILPDGLDSSLSELSPEDVRRTGRADLAIYNGLNLETTGEDLLFENKRRGALIVAYASDVDSPTREGMSVVEARDNPYLWLDPVIALRYMDTTWDSLVIVDEHADIYRANADAYKAQIRALHEQIQEKIESIPPENRKLVTFHDSFLHLANRYGLEYVRLPTPISTEEPSPRRVQDLSDLIKEQGVPAVFAEAGFNSVLLRQAASRAGVEVCTLYADAFDDEVTTYIEMMSFNADELVRCLGG